MNTKIKKISLTTFALGAMFTLTAVANGPRDLLLTAANNPGHSGTSNGTNIFSLPANTLFYNGEWDGVNGLANELNTSLGAQQSAHVFDDFVVEDAGGWDITALFSDNLADTHIIGAEYAIRQGISEGNPGTVVAQGKTFSPVVVATGRNGFGYTEYHVLVHVPGIHLDPGSYFLNVTPIGDLTGRSFDSTTSGANSIGNRGLPSNAFFRSNYFGYYFTDTDNTTVGSDFSMGIIGTVASP